MGLAGRGVAGLRLGARRDPVGPGRRREGAQLVLDPQEVDPVRRGLEPQRRQDRLTDVGTGEDAQDLADVSAEALDGEPVRGRAVPLHPVVPRRIPQERVADGRVGRGDVVRVAQIDAGRPVEDHAEGVQAGRPPGHRGPARRDVAGEILGQPRQADPQPAAVGLGRARPRRRQFRRDDAAGEALEARPVVARLREGAAQFLDEGEHVGIGRAAIDQDRPTAQVDPVHVAGGAGHADPLAAIVHILHEADGKPAAVRSARPVIRVRQVAEAREPVRDEEPVVVRALQGHEPGVRHDLRALARPVEPRALLRRPGLIEKVRAAVRPVPRLPVGGAQPGLHRDQDHRRERGGAGGPGAGHDRTWDMAGTLPSRSVCRFQ